MKISHGLEMTKLELKLTETMEFLVLPLIWFKNLSKQSADSSFVVALLTKIFIYLIP